MELIDNKQVKIVVPIDVAKVIQEHIEKVEVLKTEKNLVHLLIHWGIAEMIQLNQLCLFKNPLPSPITKDYKWTGRFHPFDHQKVTSEFLSIQSTVYTCFLFSL